MKTFYKQVSNTLKSWSYFLKTNWKASIAHEVSAQGNRVQRYQLWNSCPERLVECAVGTTPAWGPHS